jgi:hypothetical protein
MCLRLCAPSTVYTLVEYGERSQGPLEFTYQAKD